MALRRNGEPHAMSNGIAGDHQTGLRSDGSTATPERGPMSANPVVPMPQEAMVRAGNAGLGPECAAG
jgi:hypothetical protein